MIVRIDQKFEHTGRRHLICATGHLVCAIEFASCITYQGCHKGSNEGVILDSSATPLRLPARGCCAMCMLSLRDFTARRARSHTCSHPTSLRPSPLHSAALSVEPERCCPHPPPWAADLRPSEVTAGLAREEPPWRKKEGLHRASSDTPATASSAAKCPVPSSAAPPRWRSLGESGGVRADSDSHAWT